MENLKFRGRELYALNENTGMSIVRFPEEDGLSGLWKIKWPDGILSEDYYNIDRAKENAKVSWLGPSPEPVGEAVDAFK